MSLQHGRRCADTGGMLHISRPGRRLVAALVLLCTFPALAAAQDSGLRAPTIAASVAAAADWASTYHALKYYRVRESNPMLRPLDRSPGSLVTVGALVDMAAFSAWNVTMGRRNPRIAAAGLWGMAAFRTYITLHNLRNVQRSERR